MHLFFYYFLFRIKRKKEKFGKKKPIIVVEDDKVLGEDSGDGRLNAEGVAAERVEVKVGTLEGLAGGVADTSGRATNEFHGLVAEAVDPSLCMEESSMTQDG